MKTIQVKLLLFLLFFITIQVTFSQKKVFVGNPDTAFEKARELAFNSKRKQAQDSLKFILTSYPNYLDIRAFLANTYSWDGSYKLARTEFDYVLKKNPKRKTDWIAAIKNEFYADLLFNAKELIEKALVNFPNDPDILYQKARYEERLLKPRQALTTVEGILKLDENNKNAISYKESLINTLRLNTVGISYSTLIYNKNERSTSHYSTVKYGRQTKYGSITGKLNYSRRFETNSYQYEVDMYPKIMPGMYAYVSAGFSNNGLFPKVRYGAELYKSLPKSFEASLGFRGLKFSQTTIIYTGSVGWYKGNSYWSLRTYVTPGDPGASKSLTLTYRKYYSDADNYFSLSGGFGFSPEEERFPVDENNAAVFDLKSQKIGGGYYFSSKNKKNFWGTSLNISREEISYDRGEYFLMYSIGVSYSLRFK